MMSHLHAQSHKRSLMRGRGVRTTVLLLVTLIVLIPFVYMLCSAFKTGTEINSWPPTIFPRAFFGGNFQTLLETAPFPRFFVNSLGMAVLSAVGVVLTSQHQRIWVCKVPIRAEHAPVRTDLCHLHDSL